MIFLLVLLGVVSCSKEESCAPYIKPETDSIKIIWNRFINPDSSKSIIGSIFHEENEIFFTNSYLKSYSLLQCRKSDNGDMLWNYDNPQFGDRTGDNEIVTLNNEIIINASGYFFNIDKSSGQLDLDNPEFRNGHSWPPRMSLYNNYIYASYEEKGIDVDYSGLARRPWNSKAWEFLNIEYKGSGGYSKEFTPPGFHVTPQGDTTLLTAIRMWHFPKSKARFDVMAYSLKEKKFLWRIDSIDVDGNGSALPPTVWDGKAYFQGSNTIYCIDISSGKEIWRFSTPMPIYDIVQSPVIVVDGDLYMTSENNHSLYCLNASTGKLKWENTDGGNGVRKLNYFNDLIIFTSHYYLLIVDAQSGKTLWKIKSPNHSSAKQIAFNGWVPCSVNARDSVIYAADDAYIMAIKVPVRK